MNIRRLLTLTGVTAVGGALLLSSLVFRNRRIPAVQRHTNSNNPRQLLDEAEHLFWLNNPIEAQPLYARAERLFARDRYGFNSRQLSSERPVRGSPYLVKVRLTIARTPQHVFAGGSVSSPPPTNHWQIVASKAFCHSGRQRHLRPNGYFC